MHSNNLDFNTTTEASSLSHLNPFSQAVQALLADYLVKIKVPVGWQCNCCAVQARKRCYLCVCIAFQPALHVPPCWQITM